MSRGVLIFGFLLSLAIHAWLLMLPARGAAKVPTVVIPVVETELARVELPPEPWVERPEPEPEPEPEPAPRPPMKKVAETDKSDSDTPGDLAGDPEGRRSPSLRINWGTPEQALASLEAGEMIIVILGGGEPGPPITQQVSRDDGAWRRRPYRPAGATMYSNRLRIVDHVPAFEEVRRAIELRADERLAVLVPMRVERVLESAQTEAAIRHNVSIEQVENFAGRFSLNGGTLAFDVTHVGETPRSAMP